MQFTIPQAVLKTVAGAMSTDETRLYIMQIEASRRDGELTIAATDGHRIRWATAPDAGPDESITIPAAAIISAYRAKKAAKLTFAGASKNGAITAGGAMVAGWGVKEENNFPNWRDSFSTPTCSYTIPRAELAEAMAQARLILDRAIVGVYLSPVGGWLYAYNPQCNDSFVTEYDYKFSYQTPDGAELLVLNNKYLLDVLAGCKNDKLISVRYSLEELSPITIETTSCGWALNFLIMPRKPFMTYAELDAIVNRPEFDSAQYQAAAAAGKFLRDIELHPAPGVYSADHEDHDGFNVIYLSDLQYSPRLRDEANDALDVALATVDRLFDTEEPADPAPAPTTPTRLNCDGGRIEIQFPNGAPAGTSERLMSAGWNWDRKRLTWVAQATPAARELAQSIAA